MGPPQKDAGEGFLNEQTGSPWGVDFAVLRSTTVGGGVQTIVAKKIPLD